MNETEAQVLQLPKDFFVQERDKFYTDWVEAYPREFVQNSVDANARRIDITISSAPGKGSFGRSPRVPEVTRIRFRDDGHGMTRDVLDRVFFALGESTKRGEDGAVGGFGRARIMQVFSQVRYSIVTRDRFVEGDGPNYVNLSLGEARDRLRAWGGRMRERLGVAPDDRHSPVSYRRGVDPGYLTTATQDWDDRRQAERTADAHYDLDDQRIEAAARQHEADADALPDAPLRGCDFEVDLDPTQGKSHGARPTPERMERAFRDYFAKSEVRCEVWLNGELIAQPKRRLETRKRLAATMSDSEIPESFRKAGVEILDRADGRKDVVFGRLMSVSDKDMLPGERGYMNVRVKGASMYRKGSNSDNHALILELDPRVAREVLTSNRDGMRSPYSDAVDEFTRMMATDANKAMRENDHSFEVLKGGLGAKIKPRRRKEEPADDAGADFELPAAPTPRLQALEEKARNSNRRAYHSTYNWESVVKDGIEGVPFERVAGFLDGLAKAAEAGDTMLAGYRDRAKAEAFRQTLQRQGENSALEFANGDLLGYLLDQMKFRVAAEEEKASEAYKDKLGDLHDVPIQRKDMSPPEDRYPDEAERKSRRLALSRAAQRCDPRRWDHPSGKGRAPHMLLAAWQVSVDMVLDLLHDVHPDLEPFPYSVGWTFSHQRWDSVPNKRAYGWMNPKAMHVRPDRQASESYFLLNPLDDETFALRYDVRKAEDLSKLWALAAHEVAHVRNEGHTEGFAMDLTALMELSTPALRKEHERRVKEATKAVSQLFGGGQTKVQPLDDEPGPRPAERLLAGLGSAPPRPGGTGRVHDVDGGHLSDAAALDAMREPQARAWGA